VRTLVNANTRSAYQAGCFDGSFTMSEILAAGDTGLDALDATTASW
jgi:alpha-acetolactate decarboxylase